MKLLDLLRRYERRYFNWSGFRFRDRKRTPDPAPQTSGRYPSLAVFVAALVLICVWSVASLSLVYRHSMPYFQYVAGQTVSNYVYSEVPFEYEDLAQTRRKREQAASQDPPAYRPDASTTETILQELGDVHSVILGRLQQPLGSADEQVDSPPPSARILEMIGLLAPEHITTLEYVLASREKWKLLHKLVADTIRQGILDADEKASLVSGSQGVDRIHVLDSNDGSGRKSVCASRDVLTPQEAADRIARDFVQGFADNAGPSQSAIRVVLGHLLRPNLLYDFQATRAAREQAAKSVETVRRLVPAGVVLLRRGAKVTDEDILRLEKHQQELHSRRTLHESSLELAFGPVLCVLLILAAAYCLFVISPDTLLQKATMSMIGVVLILQILVSRLAADVYYLNWTSSLFLHAILPLSLGALLLAPLAGMRIAIWAGVLTSVIAALQHGRSLQILLVGGFSSIVAATLMHRARKRSHAFRAGLGVGLTVFTTCAVFLFHSEVPTDVLPKILGLALLNGIAVATVASSLLPLFEFIFGITTDLTLLELNDLNHPLLKRLQLEAPGTYHHSLMVATLAEHAAEAIGANPLLARVCAYFHDIGKLSYPEYFSENLHSDNPHEELQPRMSSLVILNHVKAGIELALKYKLRKPIREAIAQHHGTNLVYYFYRRALEQHNGATQDAKVGEHDFRYPGPLPKRKEIALISLADSCEAAARSLEKPTPQKIGALVDEIVQKRVRDHQLDDADLTFAELTVATDTIARTLQMMLHGRVRYPKEYEDEGDLFKTAEKTAAQEKDRVPASPSPGPSE